MGYVCHVVPSIWVYLFIIDVPHNGSVSEPLTHIGIDGSSLPPGFLSVSPDTSFGASVA